MASKPKKSPHPLNVDGFHATSIKLPIATYTALKDIAEKEKRPVTRQAEVFIEAGIKSTGV
jgi:predicted DNA-binding ribbon-helix-helix protein